MYCPKCHYEYEDWAKVCSTCGSALEEGSPPGEADQTETVYVKLATVFATMNTGQAFVARSVLEGAGIRVFIKGESLQGLFGYGSIGFNPISLPLEIQVPEEDAQVALELLQDIRE